MSRLKILRAFLFMLVLILPAHTGTGLDAPFAIQSIQPTTNGGFAITWSTAPGKTNQVTYTDSLNEQWQDLAGGQLVPGTNVYSLSYTDYPTAEVTQRFYRIKTTRANLVISLVLDRSGSMMGNGGAAALAPAVSMFINYFDDVNDQASMNSFSYHARTDFSMGRPFKAAITNAANALNFDGWTCSEQGLENGRQQNQSVVIQPGQSVIKVIVFFTDGSANTWQYTFDCGLRNISPGHSLYDPNTGASANSGCTVPPTIPSIDGVNNVNTSDDCQLIFEAEKRALYIANLARSQGNFIYAIGFGDPNGPQECGRPPLNTTFMKSVANTSDSLTYNPSQPSGDSVIATNAAALQQVFQEIAVKILSQSP